MDAVFFRHNPTTALRTASPLLSSNPASRQAFMKRFAEVFATRAQAEGEAQGWHAHGLEVA